MTVDQIIKELNNFNNLPYCFNSNGKPIFAILGEHNCKKISEYTEADKRYFCNLIFKIEDMSNKETITNEDKKYIGIMANKIRNTCVYRLSSIYTLEQQRDYLSQFDNNSLNNLYCQIEMYKIAFKHYNEFGE